MNNDAFDMAVHPHRRFNPLTGEWILVSPHRARRPWQGQVEEATFARPPQHDPECYLCPGNFRVTGEQNPDYTQPFVFKNDFPALLDDTPEVLQESDLFKSATALASGDFKHLSQLMMQAHEAMRDDFGLNVPAINAVVEIVQEVVGENGGVRMMGGSIGNSAIAILPKDKIEGVREAMQQHYCERTGLEAALYVCEASDGASVS